MAKEIEYKFLISDSEILKTLEFTHSEKIIQGYLTPPGMASAIRVRISEYSNKTIAEAYITVKSPKKGLSCDEFEYSIPVADALQMLNLCQGRTIHKTRYFYPHCDHIIEIDVFEDKLKGLVLAEIEIENEDVKIEFPSWFGKDVTHDYLYSNVSLSTKELSTI